MTGGGRESSAQRWEEEPMTETATRPGCWRCLEFPPIPTEAHQLILKFLPDRLPAFVAARSLGKALMAGLVARLWPGKVREER